MTKRSQDRLFGRLDGAHEAWLATVEAYLRACGWTSRRTKGGHRAWVKEGKRTLVVPVHGTKVREHVIRQILEATREEGEDQAGD